MDNTEFWDKKAQHFQNTMINNKGKEKDSLVKHLKDCGMVFKGGRVLDIGCGTGKYAVEFANAEMFVCGIDISPKMLKFARENLINVGGDFDLILSTWQDIDENSLTEDGKYDLVFASNSPGIRDISDIEKMCKVSKKYCFINKYANRSDYLKEDFAKYIGVIRNDNVNKEKAYSRIIEHIKKLGYKPECKFARQDRAYKQTASETVNDFVAHMKLDGIVISDEEKEKLQKYADSIKDKNGLLEERITAEVIWVKWEV